MSSNESLRKRYRRPLTVVETGQKPGVLAWTCHFEGHRSSAEKRREREGEGEGEKPGFLVPYQIAIE
jgi:hypothetical protein